ncbi:MAG: PIN domain-containing protein [Verrucomicrobiaceae bacterium]|nr:MAG: PIN domain-containing protein [Verrucomicrobiaceae bacterium]
MKPLLVDSSYWIGLARRKLDPMTFLTTASFGRELAICGVVRCEVARGIRQEAALNRLRKFWDVMVYVPTDNVIWNEVEKLLWQMDRSGLKIPQSDAVIACCAQRIGAAVLTFDLHFRQIPGLSVISSLDLI